MFTRVTSKKKRNYCKCDGKKRRMAWKMGELVVYRPGIETCVGSVDQVTTGELCDLPVYCFKCWQQTGPF